MAIWDVMEVNKEIHLNSSNRTESAMTQTTPTKEQNKIVKTQPAQIPLRSQEAHQFQDVHNC